MIPEPLEWNTLHRIVSVVFHLSLLFEWFPETVPHEPFNLELPFIYQLIFSEESWWYCSQLTASQHSSVMQLWYWGTCYVYSIKSGLQQTIFWLVRILNLSQTSRDGWEGSWAKPQNPSSLYCLLIFSLQLNVHMLPLPQIFKNQEEIKVSKKATTTFLCLTPILSKSSSVSRGASELPASVSHCSIWSIYCWGDECYAWPTC